MPRHELVWERKIMKIDERNYLIYLVIEVIKQIDFDFI